MKQNGLTRDDVCKRFANVKKGFCKKQETCWSRAFYYIKIPIGGC